MHIPDGYLCPQTWITFYAAMLPIWVWSAIKTRKSLKSKYIPTLAIGSAFSLILMMFNIPIPGGITGHAIGATLLSLIFGPYASILIISLTLAIQALLFGDGGITSFAVNSFIMGYIASFAGYYSYKYIILLFPVDINSNMLASGIAGYISSILASFCTGIILGIQPILSPTANNMPIYFSHSLEISILSILIGHILVFGWIECFVTALAYGFLLKEKSPVLNILKEDTSLEIS